MPIHRAEFYATGTDRSGLAARFTNFRVLSPATALAGLCIVMSVGIAAPVYADEDENVAEEGETATVDIGSVTDRILVTVRRIEEVGADVPLTIRVFEEEEIVRTGVTDISDVANLTPGMTFDIGGFPNDTRPAVRGMQVERGRPSVAIMLDGLDLSGENLGIAGGGAGVTPDLIDLERIEVVKGPQTTLYGRNAFAGAVNYVSRKPSEQLEGRLILEGAEYGKRRAVGMIGGSIVDGLMSYRINAAYREQDGFYTNPVTGGPLGKERFDGIAAALRFTPGNRWDITLRYQTNSTENSESPTAFLAANERLPVPDGTFTAGPPGSPALPCPADLSGQSPQVVQACTRGTVVGPIRASIDDVQMDFNPLTGEPPRGLTLDQDLVTLDAAWETDVGKLRYTFGWIDNDSFVETDGDFTSFPAPPGPVFSISALQLLDYSDERFDHNLFWTQSIGDFDLLLGGQRLTEDSTLSNASLFWLRNPDSPLAGPPFFLANQPVTDAFPVDSTRDTTYNALYGSLNWNVTDRLRLGFEARYNRDRVTYGISGWTRQDVALSGLEPVCLPGIPQGARFTGQPGPDVPPPGTVQGCPRTTTLSYGEWTPRVTLNWQYSDEIMLYGNVARGFKPGGFNVLEIIEFEGQEYQPEFVDAFEIGVKSLWPNLNLAVDAALFFNDYTDQQIGVQRVQPGTGDTAVAVPGIANAGAVEAWGFELESSWFPTDRLAVNLGYTYVNSTFDDFAAGPAPGAGPESFAECGVPEGRVSSPQLRAEAGNACGDYSGNRVGKNPKHAVNASTLYRAPLGQGLNTWFVELAGQYRSRRFLDESNLSWMPSYTVFDLRAGLEFERFSIIGYVNNLTDDDTIRSAQRNIDQGRPEGFAPGRGAIAYLPDPRQAGLRFIYQFGHR